MQILKSQKEFREFYEDKIIVKTYDSKRLNSVRQMTLREFERSFPTNIMQNNSTIIEIGCGTGFITKYLATKGNVLATDSSEAMLKEAKKNIITNKVSFSKIDLFKLNLNKKFDYAISIRVILHLNKRDYRRALEGIAPVLKNNGLFIFDLESKSLFKTLCNKISPFYKNKEVANPQYSKKDILKNTPNSFEIIQIVPYDHAIINLPFFIIAEAIASKKVSNVLIFLEKKLDFLPFFNTRWFVVCKKKA